MAWDKNIIILCGQTTKNCPRPKNKYLAQDNFTGLGQIQSLIFVPGQWPGTVSAAVHISTIFDTNNIVKNLNWLFKIHFTYD